MAEQASEEGLSKPEDTPSVTESWGLEKDAEPEEFDVKRREVDEMDKFQLASRILSFAGALYILLAGVYVALFPEKISEVWDYSKVLLNSLVSLIIGYYFGSNRK